MKKYLFSALLSLITIIGYTQTPNWINNYPKINFQIDSLGDTTLLIAVKFDKPTTLYLMSCVVPYGRLTATQVKNSSLTGIVTCTTDEMVIRISCNSLHHYFYLIGENSSGLMSNSNVKRFTRLQEWQYTNYSTYSEDINYTVLPPSNYYSTTTTSPVLISLHGDGEKLSSTVNLDKLLYVASGRPPYMAEHGINFDPFILVSPQDPWWFNITSTGANALDKVIKDIKTKYRVDPTKIYLTALSGSGGIAYQYPGDSINKIAAVVQVAASINAAGYTTTQINNMALIPFWCFHNNNDPTVSVGTTNNMVTSINNSPNLITPAKKTIYTNNIHDAWTATYNKSGNTNDIYSWLLQYSTTVSTVVSPPNTLVSNIALNKTVYIDSDLGYPGYENYKAVDGNITTKWNSSNASGAHWMYIDLGGNYIINKIVVKHTQNNSSLITRDFTVQYCDAVCSGGYTIINTYSGNTSATTTDFVNITARYVKINITKPSQYGSSASIYELEVYGY